MWRVPLVLNTLLVCLFGCLSMGSQIALHNRFVQYAEPEPKPLPSISELAIHYWWIYAALPLAWILLLAVLLLRFHRTGIAAIYQNVHASASVLVGMLMLGFFVLAGVLPFVSLVVGMQK